MTDRIELDMIECQPMKARLTERICSKRRGMALSVWEDLVNGARMYRSPSHVNWNLDQREKFSVLYFCGTCEKTGLGITKTEVLKKMFEGDQKQFHRIRLGTEDYGASVGVDRAPDLPDLETQESSMR